MKRCLLIMVCIVFCVLLCSCDSSKKLIGDWVLESGETDVDAITFYSDGTCMVANDEMGKWKITDGVLMVLGGYGGGQFWYYDNLVGSYKVDGNKLIFEDCLIDGDDRDTLTYVRLK